MLGKLTTAAIVAQRWYDLERPGFPHKCFMVEVTYGDGTRIAFDPIYSFVRAWDSKANNLLPQTSSMGHWEATGDYNASLPVFCSGKNGNAVSLKSSSGLDQLLRRPYVIFSVDFDH